MTTRTGEPTLHIDGAMSGAKGTAREINEDFIAYVLPEADDPRAARGVLSLIADGMGGHAAGEVASALAGEIIVRRYYTTSDAPDAALFAGFQEANIAIRERAKAHREQRGMGTTCTAVAIRNGSAWLAHIGDSRLYLWRAGQLYQLSEDHSLVGELVRAQIINSAEARSHPERNVIVRALGTHKTADVDVWREGMPLAVGDILLLCSDGLSDVIDNSVIAEVLQTSTTPYAACGVLVAAAQRMGGLDDVSVGVLAVRKEAPATPRSVCVTRSRLAASDVP